MSLDNTLYFLPVSGFTRLQLEPGVSLILAGAIQPPFDAVAVAVHSTRHVGKPVLRTSAVPTSALPVFFFFRVRFAFSLAWGVLHI